MGKRKPWAHGHELGLHRGCLTAGFSFHGCIPTGASNSSSGKWCLIPQMSQNGHCPLVFSSPFNLLGFPLRAVPPAARGEASTRRLSACAHSPLLPHLSRTPNTAEKQFIHGTTPSSLPRCCTPCRLIPARRKTPPNRKRRRGHPGTRTRGLFVSSLNLGLAWHPEGGCSHTTSAASEPAARSCCSGAQRRQRRECKNQVTMEKRALERGGLLPGSSCAQL